MTRTSIIILLLFYLSTSGQTSVLDCKKILKKEPYFVRQSAPLLKDSVRHDFKILYECGGLDSIDLKFMDGGMLGTILIKHQPKSKTLTYKAILDSYKEFKKTPDYLAAREMFVLSNRIELETADPNGLEQYNSFFISMGMEEADFFKFKQFISDNLSSRWTYRKAFEEFSDVNVLEDVQVVTPALKFSEFTDLQSVVDTATKFRKPLLIYFTCYACVNSRKMDDRILTDAKVKSLITDNYVYFAAYVDDNSPDEKAQSTVGKKNQRLQADFFKSTTQPHFFILDSKGNKVVDQDYTSNVDDFVQFLKKGLP